MKEHRYSLSKAQITVDAVLPHNHNLEEAGRECIAESIPLPAGSDLHLPTLSRDLQVTVCAYSVSNRARLTREARVLKGSRASSKNSASLQARQKKAGAAFS